MPTQVNFRCDRDTLERRVTRILKLAGEARLYMDHGNTCACIAKYHAMDIELGRLANMAADDERKDLDGLVTASSNGTNPPGK